MKSGKLSFERDANGAKVIDGSELVRVYGSDCDFNREEGTANASAQGKGHALSKDDQSLHSQLTNVQQQLEQQIEERRRERQQSQDQIDRLTDALKSAQEGHNKALLLLQHQGGGAVNETIKALEAWIGDQLAGVKDQISEVRIQTRRKTIDELKSKSWLGAMLQLIRE